MFNHQWHSRSYEVALPKQPTADVSTSRALGQLAASAGRLVAQAGEHLALSHAPVYAPAVPQRVQAERADDGAWVFVASLARPQSAPYWLVDYAVFSLEPAAEGPRLVLGDLRVDQRYQPDSPRVDRPTSEQLQTAHVLSSLAQGFEGLVDEAA
jgi:hypothetical protein